MEDVHQSHQIKREDFISSQHAFIYEALSQLHGHGFTLEEIARVVRQSVMTVFDESTGLELIAATYGPYHYDDVPNDLTALLDGLVDTGIITKEQRKKATAWVRSQQIPKARAPKEREA